MTAKKTPVAVSIMADHPLEQLRATLETASLTDAFVTLEGAGADRFEVLAWHFAQYGYRCIGQTDQPLTHQFARLDANKQHIVVMATNDNFHFLQPVMRLMRGQGHVVSEISSHSLTQKSLLNALRHCDVAWFEWGDGAIVPASKLPKYCRIVCRIHRYELYGEAFLQANWENIDEVILVSQAMKARFITLLGETLPAHLKVTVLANLTEHAPVAQTAVRPNPFHIACVARFAPQKNLVMLLPIMQALVKQDSRYKLFIAGRIEDHCLYDSFCQLVEIYGLQRNVVVCGPLAAADMPAWYANKSFILSTSYHESQGMGIFEAMLAGLKPIAFHAPGGLSEYLPAKYLFTSLDDAVARIAEGNLDAQGYVQEAQSLLQQHDLTEDYPPVWQTIDSPQPLFSVLIPTYNREKYLLPAVCSALNQGDHNIEVVVVDDGSTDRSLATLEQINDPRLRIIRKAHTNAPDTRNHAIAQAQGDFLVWLDSDDLLHANAVSHYRTLLQHFAQVDVISCGLETLQGEKQYFSLRNQQPANGLAQLPYGNVISNPGCCVRRSLYAKVGDYNPTYLRAHDYEFWSRAMGVANVAFTAQCNIAYRLHDDNLTGIGKPVDCTYEYRIFQAIIQRYRPKALFPGQSHKQISAFIKTRQDELYQACKLDNLIIILNTLDHSVETVIEQIKGLNTQRDKQFSLLLIANDAQPFSTISGLTVLNADALNSTTLVAHQHEKFPNQYCRLFTLEPGGEQDPLLITTLKQALLHGTPIAPHFQRITW